MSIQLWPLLFGPHVQPVLLCSSGWVVILPMGPLCPSWDPLIPPLCSILGSAQQRLVFLGAHSPSGLCGLHLHRAQSVCSQSCCLCDGFSDELFILSGRDDPACSRGQLAMSEHSAVILRLGHCHFVGGSHSGWGRPHGAVDGLISLRGPSLLYCFILFLLNGVSCGPGRPYTAR